MKKTGLLLADVRPEKLFYRAGEDVTGVVTLINLAGNARSAQARVWIEHDLDGKTGFQTKDATVPGGGVQSIHFSWPASEIALFGQALAVEIVEDGKVIAQGMDVFACSDNLWDMAIGARPDGPAASSARYSEEQILDQVRGFRDKYCNIWEKYFWAPDDWGLMTTAPGATWFSGQARRHENTEKLKLQIDASRAEGIAVVTYGKCMAGGPHGWEMARAKPQWFFTDVNGHTMGRPADVWDLDHWQEGDKHKYTDYKYVWTYRWVDLRRLDALDHGIDQLIASTRQFGWDGVRFDSGGFRAHFVDGHYNGNDAVNTRNMKRTKERIRQEFPSYIFGYNTDNTASTDARDYPLTLEEMSHEMREMLAGGGLWMGEGIKYFANGGVTYSTWSRYAREERRCIQAIREAGGHFCYLFHAGTDVRNVYQFVIGLMNGAHPYGGEHAALPGSANWGMFMTRWGGLLWDSRLRALDIVQAEIAVTASTELWWREFANERVLDANRRQVIVHLMNPPVDDEIANALKVLHKDVIEIANQLDQKDSTDNDEEKDVEDLMADLFEKDPDDAIIPSPSLAPAVLAMARAQRFPAPVQNTIVTLRIPDGQSPRTVWLLTPGNPDRAGLIDWKIEDGRVLATIPSFDIWAMVVCEFTGVFATPPPAEPFSPPLSIEESAELERGALNPSSGDAPAFGLRPPKPTPNIPVIDSARPVFTVSDESPSEEKKIAIEQRDTVAENGGHEFNVLVMNGFWHAFHRVPEAIRTVAPRARITQCTTRDLPDIFENSSDHDTIAPSANQKLAAYDLVALVNFPASDLSVDAHRALADFVLAGGRLVILGGPFTLGQGAYFGSPLEPLLPVQLQQGPDVVALSKPLPLGLFKNAELPERPMVYFAHAAKPIKGAKVRVWAGEWPMLVEGAAGQGSVAALLATPLGESQAGELPFWETSSWLSILGHALAGPLHPGAR